MKKFSFLSQSRAQYFGNYLSMHEIYCCQGVHVDVFACCAGVMVVAALLILVGLMAACALNSRRLLVMLLVLVVVWLGVAWREAK